jgi:SPX domain protein involved in polyphosphate accumulation
VSFPIVTHLYPRLTEPRKARTTSHNWNAADEAEFTNMLEGELDKIHDFQKAKVYLPLLCHPALH